VTIRWAPGHERVHSNEEAAKAVKKAAKGRDSSSPLQKLPEFLYNGPLPLNISALLQNHCQITHECWTQI
ncbi:hypothetical protein BDR06DRAFT_833707, partial [Suillus hirtellus]